MVPNLQTYIVNVGLIKVTSLFKIVNIPNWLEMGTVMMKPIIYIVTLMAVTAVFPVSIHYFVQIVNV